MQLSKNKIVLREGDDMHVHIREGAMTKWVLPYTARYFGRGVIMPNTIAGIHTARDAKRYERFIYRTLEDLEISGFTPLMTILLTEATTPEMIDEAADAGVTAIKVYLSGTTNAYGMNTLRSFDHAQKGVLKRAADRNMLLLIHGEHPPPAFSLYREREFMPTFRKVVKANPDLRIVLEHVSSKVGMRTVIDMPDNVAATITMQHLCFNLDAVIGNGLDPHAFCMPLLKMPEDQKFIWDTVRQGFPRALFGSDTAPHRHHMKVGIEAGPNQPRVKGKPGQFTAPLIMQQLVSFGEAQGDLKWIEPFTSEFGAKFYGLEPNKKTITLVREPYQVPYKVGSVVPFMAGQTLPWSIL